MWFACGSGMEDTNSLVAQGRANLATLEAKGIHPFRNKFTPDSGCGEAREKFEKGELAEGHPVAIAGRITAHRDMGKSQFVDLRDVTGRIQVYAQKAALGDEAFENFRCLDLADFVGARGTLFRTRTGEPSLKLESFTVLGKALRPPPAKWEGLADTEIRYRQRYLDLMSNEDVKRTFLLRSAVIREIRSFFHERGYVEVETPMMQAIPGGAAAQPFKTFHNALGCEFYLRIALELYLKRLLVGGIDKVFEIGRNFRNEGLSRRHNPEFTMLEAYEAYGDYATMMETVESVIVRVCRLVNRDKPLPEQLLIWHDKRREVQQWVMHALLLLQGKLGPRLTVDPLAPEEWQALGNLKDRISGPESAAEADKILVSAISKLDPNVHQETLQGLGTIRSQLARLSIPVVIDLTRPWRRVRYKDLIQDVAGADWFEVTPAERRRRAIEDLKLAGDIADGYEDFEVTGAVFEKLVEPTLIQPTFVTHLPKQLVPLAKLSPDDPTTVEVFECCINGQEISPGYTEQNDPVAQREALEHQAGGEQQKLDEDFLVALEHGMPPAGGIGIGIDRLCMMLLGQESIRDVILFPQLKPKG